VRQNVYFWEAQQLVVNSTLNSAAASPERCPDASAVRFADFEKDPPRYPAMNRWAISDRPLRGLSVLKFFL
jgi:hypothetical protein